MFQRRMTISHCLYGLAILIAPSLVLAQKDTPITERKPIAIVDGEAVYMDQAPPMILGQIERLRREYFDLQKKALDEITGQKLLEREAKRRGISLLTLMRTEIEGKVAEPTPDEVEAFDLGKSGHPFPGEHAAADPTSRELLKQARLEAARQAYIKELWRAERVLVFLDPPRSPTTIDPTRLRGNPNAAIRLVEFSDFSCPFCRRAESSLTKVLEHYKGIASIAYRDFPLNDIHPQAELAAEASRCAADQRKYWEYHDLLFTADRPLTFDFLVAKASELSLDRTAFVSCLGQQKHKVDVQKDIEDGTRLGVMGTPAFFINGIFLGGAQPVAEFERIIDSELASTRNN